MKVNLESVIEAIESLNNETVFYYVIPEETIISSDDPAFKDDTYDEYDLIRLPDKRDIDDYGNMQRFIERLDDETAREWLSNAIKGRGAFRMFRATLERFHLTQDWYDYRDRCHRIAAMDWCEDNGIEYEGPRYVIQEDSFDDEYDDEEEEDIMPVRTSVQPQKKEYRIVEIGRKNVQGLIFLASDYHDEMLAARGFAPQQDPDSAQDRLTDCLNRNCRIFAVSDHGRYLGYCVYNENENSASVEEMYVRKELRRKGIGTLLIKKADETAAEKNLPLSFHIQPDNDAMIELLKVCGYHTVETIEIVRNPKDLSGVITVGDHNYFR